MRDYASSQHAVPCVPCGGPGAGYVRPDITGSFSPNYNGDSGGFHFSSGAIYSGCFNRGKKVDFSCGWGHYGDDYALNFAAHYSNNVYGNSSSVSVPAAYSLIIIRT